MLVPGDWAPLSTKEGNLWACNLKSTGTESAKDGHRMRPTRTTIE